MAKKKEKVFIPKAIGMTKTQIKDSIGEDWFVMLAWGDNENHSEIMSLNELELPHKFCQEYVDMCQEVLESDLHEEDRGEAEYDLLVEIITKYPRIIKQIKELSAL